MSPAVARPRLLEDGAREVVPAEVAALGDLLARERAVGEAAERHEPARRVAEDVAVALRVGAGRRHRREHRVAGAEADHGGAGLGRAHADQAGRVVAREGDHRRVGREAVALDEVVGDHARLGRARDGRLELPSQARARSRPAAGGLQAPRARSSRFMPAPSPKSIGDAGPGQQRRDERADQVDLGGALVAGGIVLRELADLRSGEAFDRARAGQRHHLVVAAGGGARSRRTRRRSSVHPDRRGRARQQRAHLVDQRLARPTTARPRRSGAPGRPSRAAARRR